MREGEGVGVNLIWAITILIVVAIIGGAIYYSGALSGAGAVPDKKIDVEVKVPNPTK